MARNPSKKFKRFWFIFHLLRWTCLFGLLLASLQLVVWNRKTDPRFYRFLSTPPGQLLAKVMQWPSLYSQRVIEKPESEYTDEERVWLRKLEQQLASSWPTHTLTLTNGKVEYVRITDQQATGLYVQEHFGGKGTLSKFIPWNTILKKELYAEPLPTVTWRDVRFQMEYPDFHLTYFGHYTVLTDAPYFQVEASVRELEILRTRYMELFGELVRFPKSNQTLQVLFFSKEEDYREHQQDSAPDLVASAGYYSPLEDRMVVFNQQHSERAREIREEVRDKINVMLEQSSSREDRQHILRMQTSVEQQMKAQGQVETQATLRHEGAHHLAYTYGIHSWIHSENAWLIEGNAVYAEPLHPGDIPYAHVASLIRIYREGRLPELERLMSVRQPKNFATELPTITPSEAYALSWTLFHFCMQPRHRAGFFDYLRYLQDPPDIETLMTKPRVEILADKLGYSSPKDLEEDWKQHMNRL
jgi:hypothetical protein